MTQTPNNLASYCWPIADLLRGDFKQPRYDPIILPFTLLRRLGGVLEQTKEQVLAEYEKVQKMKLIHGLDLARRRINLEGLI
jgi:type I restriction enzyme M protein